MRKIFISMTAVLSICALAACDSSEDRAEEYYQSGLEYLAKGDIDRALVELRNVFKLDGEHREARRTYAEVERDRGNFREAYSQYLRLLEQYPDDQAATVALAEIAVRSGDFATAKRYAEQALARTPEDTTIQALDAVAVYGIARTSSDTQAQSDALKRIKALYETMSESEILQSVIISDLIDAKDYEGAQTVLEKAIAQHPRDPELHAFRLSIRGALGDEAGVEAGLLDMIATFPELPEVNEALVRYYIARGELEKAEEHLRTRIANDAGDPDPVFDLTRFLAANYGDERALAELDQIISDGDRRPDIRAARAAYEFQTGKTDAAIAEMQEVLDETDAGDEARRFKVSLAKMLTQSGNPVRARALVESVLSEDQGNLDAMLMKARWLIDSDQMGEAISILRRALDHNPRNSYVMTLMAEAYERDGNRDLMREMLSLAVDASNRGPDESLRYASLLSTEGKKLPAEGVLIEALRLSPGNPALLIPLGQIYIDIQDWPRAGSVAATLEQSDDPAVRATGANLQAVILSAQQRDDEAVAFLQRMIAEGKAGMGARIAILQSMIANSETDRALAYSSELLSEAPKDPDLRFLDATVQAFAGKSAEAEAAFRALVEENAAAVNVWMALIRLVSIDPAREEEAVELVDRALSENPDSIDLKWIQASYYEHSGKIEDAIRVYEGLYKENSGNPIIANNLASLLSVGRDDPDSLARAEIIARRLRGTEVPAFQDTYGWISYRRGNYQDALEALTSAAAALTEDPNVQYHLGMTYLALDQKSDALKQLRAALALVDENDSRPFAVSARSELKKLEAEGVN